MAKQPSKPIHITREVVVTIGNATVRHKAGKRVVRPRKVHLPEARRNAEAVLAAQFADNMPDATADAVQLPHMKPVRAESKLAQQRRLKREQQLDAQHVDLEMCGESTTSALMVGTGYSGAKPLSKAAQKREEKATKQAAKVDAVAESIKQRLLAVGDEVVEYHVAGGQSRPRQGTVVKVWLAGGEQRARVKLECEQAGPTDEDVLLELPARQFRRVACACAQLQPEPVPSDDITPYRPTEKVDVNIYQVYRDKNGVAYLRVGYGKHGAMLVVNKGHQVELIDMPNDTIRSHYLQPVLGSSILDAAKQLLHPPNPNVTISVRAKAQLISILENEELKNMATKAVAAVKPAKFASVNAPAAKGKKAVAQPKGTKAAKAVKKEAGAPRAASARSEEIWGTKVVFNPKTTSDLREGSTFAVVAKLATKPILLSALADKLAATFAANKERRSQADPLVVAKGYTRDAFTRFQYLQAAK